MNPAGDNSASSTMLSLDCSGSMCTVALQCGGEQLLLGSGPAITRHSQHILRLSQQLLANAGITVHQLDAIVFGKGPGSFTGLRVAAATAMGLATGAGLPVIAVSTLAALAQAHAARHVKIAVARNARLGEIYYGAYEVRNGIATAVREDALLQPQQLQQLQSGQWFGAGDGWLLAGINRSALYNSDHTRVPTALDFLSLACTAPRLNAAEAIPSYIRNQVARPRGSHHDK